jgi:GH18 family chitinase
VHPATTNVILAFANTQADGSIIVDTANFPSGPYAQWKAAGMNVLISVGGANGNWNNVFASNASITAFVNSLVAVVTQFNLDGVDLDI